jgi:hypothetical protein
MLLSDDLKRGHVNRVAGGLLTLLAASAYAQPAQPPVTQKVTGPQARYWLSSATTTGFSASSGASAAGGLGAMMGMVTGLGGGASRSLLLELGTTRTGSDLTADHAIPAGMAMGASLPLIGPERGKVRDDPETERDIPRQERPEGNVRMLFFWGCGDTVGAGQPVVLDMKQMMDGRLPPSLQSFAINSGPSGPASGRDKTYVSWPNARSKVTVPADGSMVGDHRVKGNATVDIPFAVAPAHDVMAGVTLTSQATASGNQTLGWNSVPTAIGYFSTAMGFKETGDKSTDVVMWNSSAKRLLGGDRLMHFLPPPEVARLIRESVVMPPSQTECTIPAAVSEAAGGSMTMLNLNAFGPELNIVHPPRPQDPKVDWNQDYTVKLRLHSSTSTMAGMGPAGSRPGSSASGRPQTATNAPAADGEAPAAAAAPDKASRPPASNLPNLPNIPNAIGEGVNMLKGLFGR